MGTTLISLGVLVFLVLLALPFLLRDDAGKLTVNRRGSSEGTFTIPGNIKEASVPPKHQIRQSGSPKSKTNFADPEKREKTAPRPPLPPMRKSSDRISVGSSGRKYQRNGKNASASPKHLITIIDGENTEAVKKDFVSDRYAPYGRLIACKMVNTIESGDTSTPLIAFVSEDLWWINSKGEKKLIIPAGTEVHGSVQGAKPLRNRLTTGNNFVLVWQASSDMVGFELQLKGIALEKSNASGTKNLAAISDMAAGIPGQVISNENLAKFLMYTLAFGQGMAQGFQTTEVVSNSSSTVVTQQGTTKNALARGAETLAQIMLQDISRQISKESYYIRVPAGTEFYLFVQQTINLDEAKIAGTLLNKLEEEKTSGNPKNSHRNILNRFSSQNRKD